jgi:hypothetical protein
VIVIQNNIYLNFPWKIFRKEVISFSSSLEVLPTYLRTFSWAETQLFSPYTSYKVQTLQI